MSPPSAGAAKEADEICDFLLKDGKTNMVRVVPANTPGAKDAKLRYQKCGEVGELTLVRVRLFTGRSHQIRVQLSHAGLPIWGDARYGGGRARRADCPLGRTSGADSPDEEGRNAL